MSTGLMFSLGGQAASRLLTMFPVDTIGAEQSFRFPASGGNFVSTGAVQHDQFASELDGNPVVLTFDNFTINAGHLVTTTNRCRGLYLQILGDLVINGTLSMTARGPNCPGKFVGIDPVHGAVHYNETDIFTDKGLYLINKAGGAATAGMRNLGGGTGLWGTPATGFACGGGSPGSVVAKVSVAVSGGGGAGTSFAGGAGGGAAANYKYTPEITAGSAGINGGTGGQAVANATTWSASAGGGAGNPGGQGATVSGSAAKGEDGVGGLIILVVKGNIIFGSTGSVQSKGSAGGGASAYGGANAGGGGSGGGSINVFYQQSLNRSDLFSATGGPGGVASGGGSSGSNMSGGKGGDGTIRLVAF